MAKLWPEDPLGPPLSEADLDRIITVPELRAKLGLHPLTQEERAARLRAKRDKRMVTCQGCLRTMEYGLATVHECDREHEEALRDLLSLV